MGIGGLGIYCIGGIFRGKKISRISRFRKIYTQKTKKLYAWHLIFDQFINFNLAKYTTYTVHVHVAPPSLIIIDNEPQLTTYQWYHGINTQKDKAQDSFGCYSASTGNDNFNAILPIGHSW